MSINVTVNGNPISIRRGKMILSDLENIKKSEKEHRKRLRMEQVLEQSRAISKTLLERTRQAKKDQLDRLEQDENTEMRKAHDKRLMDFHRRYQDIENIGLAHKNAAMQPDVETIRLEEERRNRALAKARGADAMQRLEESKKVVSPHSTQQDLLRKVREFENERSCLVSQLPKKPSAESSKHPSTRRRVKCVVSKKSPIRKTPKHVKVRSTQTKTPHISVSVEDDEDDDLDKTLTEENACTNTSKKVGAVKSPNDSKKVSDTFEQVNRGSMFESDENEPRRTVPVTSSVPKKPESLGRHGYQNSSSDLTSSSTASSSSISDDSSYFSDNANSVKKTPRHHTSPASSKVSMYDHKTRQRKEYERPPGLVERFNIKNVPNAQDLAQEIIELENKESSVLACQKEQAQKRTQDAILREKVKRDYQALMKNLDLLSKEERKLKANQVATDRQVPAPSKNSENLARRQKKMDRAFESILRNSRDPDANETPMERPITITPRDYVHSKQTPANEWREPPYIDEQEYEVSGSEEDDEYTRKRKISELLIKIEQLKRQLLQEYGPNLPDDVFDASLRSLFNNNNTNQSAASTSQNRASRATPKPTPPAPPEIQVINMSSEENIKLANKIVASQCKKFISRPPPPKPTPKTSSSTMTTSTRDQETQVEMEKSKEKAPHPIDPVVKVVTPTNADSSTSICSSNSSVSTDVVIDVSKKEVTLVPKKKISNVKASKSSSMMSAKSTKTIRRASAKTPVKITFEQKEGAAIQVAIDPEKKEITVLPKKKKQQLLKVPSRRESPIISGHTTRSLPGSRMNSPSKKLSKSAPPSRHSSPKKPQAPSRQSFEEHRYREQFTQVSIDSSTSINSSSSSITANHYSRYTTARRVVTKDTSDASTTYISPPAGTPGAFIDDANDTRAMILELLEMDPAELRRRAQEVSPVSSPETPSPRTMMIPSNMPRNNKVNKNLQKFMSLVHAQTDTKRQTSCSGATQTQTRSSTTQTQVKSGTQMKSSTQATTRRSAMEKSRTCNCRDPGCRLFHEKIKDVNQYTLKHCPEILKKYESLQQDCTERIASLTDLIEKVRSEQRGVNLSIETSNGDSNTMAQTQTTIPSGPSTATSINVNELVKNIESIHAQLKQTLVESQKIISQKTLDSSKSPLPAVTAREKSPSLDWSKDTLTNDSLEVSTEKTKSSAVVATQQPPQQQQQQQQPPFEKSKPTVLNSERVNIRIDRFRVSQDTKSTGTEMTAEQQHQQSEDQVVEQLSKEILEQSKSINKSVPPVDKSKDSDDDPLKSSQAPVKQHDEASKNAPTAAAVASSDNDEDNRSDSLEASNSEYVPLLAGIPKMSRKNSSNNGGRTRPPVTLISGPYRPEIVSPVHELSTIVEFDTPDTVNKSQISTRSPANKCRKRLPTGEASGSSSPTKRVEVKLSKNKPSVHVAPLPPHRSPQSLNVSNKSVSKSIEKSPRKSIESPLEKIKLSTSGLKKCESSDSLHTLPDVHIEELQQSQDNGDGNYLRVSQISELHSIPDEDIDDLMISEIYEEAKSASPVQKTSPDDGQDSDKGQLSSVSSRSISNVSGVSEITTTPSSDLNRLKYPTSPEDLEEGLKKLGLNWALATLKKTREASALGSSSSSDATPINTTAARLVSPLKKSSHHESTVHDLPEVSDVSSISMKHANKSTEKSVLVKGRTSTPNRLLEEGSETNSSGTISTLDSFSSDAIQVAHDHSAEHSIPNISFK